MDGWQAFVNRAGGAYRILTSLPTKVCARFSIAHQIGQGVRFRAG